MLAAVFAGNVKKLAELIRQDPGFKVGEPDGVGITLLHYACSVHRSSSVIPLLLAHPDIDVNAKTKSGITPFYLACYNGYTSCVRELLKDARVKVNEPTNEGDLPLLEIAWDARLDIIKWWIASGREIDLEKPDGTDAIGVAKRYGERKAATLMNRFKRDATQTRHEMRVELGLVDQLVPDMLPWWSLSLMAYSKSKTPLRRLQPDSSPLQNDYHLNSR